MREVRDAVTTFEYLIKTARFIKVRRMQCQTTGSEARHGLKK